MHVVRVCVIKNIITKIISILIFVIHTVKCFLCWCVSDAKITIRAVVVATLATSGCVEGISFSTVYTKVDSF